MRRLIAGLGLVALLSGPVAAQEATTLADMRAELSSIQQGLASLRAELMASGPQGFQAAGGDSAIDRMNAMEAHLAELTGRMEQWENRVGRIVSDSALRLDDLEFRLCEMDPNCDLSALTSMDPLTTGFDAPDFTGNGPDTTQTNGAEATTAAEQADFDLARQVMGQGDFRRAAELFAAVAQNHAGGPLTAEALYLRGVALDGAGQPRAAAAAWLEGFAADPDGPRGGDSLLGIARVIADDGDAMASCLYLAEIPARFPGSPQAAEADRRMLALNCGSGQLGLDAAGATLDILSAPPGGDPSDTP